MIDHKPAMRPRSPWAWIPSLYFIEGLPNAIIVTITVILYKDFGISNERIAFYTGMLYLPWVIKPFWSPFVDILKSKRWWIVAMQVAMAAAFGCVALSLSTSVFFATTLVLFWIAAFTSATNDIASDGFYMLALDSHDQSRFVGIRSTFYRVAMWFVQFALVFMAGWFERRTGSVTAAWTIVFFVLAAIFLCCALYHLAVLPRPGSDVSREARTAGQIMSDFGRAFASFFRKPQILAALAFMLLYRFPEAQLVKMINLFLLDSAEAGGLGLTKEAVSITYGVWGVAGLLIGGIVGGMFVANRGLRSSLKPMAWSMSLSCLTFVLLSQLQSPSRAVIDVCVFAEQFGYGFGFSAYMLYLIYFSKGEYATAHYAICTAFMAVGLMLPGMAAGWIQQLLGYANFFLWTTACCVATIGVAYLVKVDPAFGTKSDQQ